MANGMGGPSFLARLPDRQADLGLSDAALGATLVGLAFGALVASPIVARMLRRWSSRRVAVTAGVGLGATLWLVGAAPSAPTFFLAMAIVGVFDAGMDIAMNANGAAYEAMTGRSVLHRLHAAWSLGALAAAAVAGLATAAGVSLTTHLAVVGALAAVATVAARRYLVPGEAAGAQAASVGFGDAEPPSPGSSAGRDDGRAGGAGRAALLALGAAVVGGALIEGGTNDWAAIQMERYGSGEALAAAGVACFMAGMLAGRTVGDRLVERWGDARLLRTGTTLAAVGLAAGALVPHPLVFAVGVFVTGLGAAGLFPLAFSAAARIPGVAPGTGAAVVSLGARLGFLVEPLLIGLVAEQVGLRWSYGLIAAIAAALAVSAPHVIRTARAPAGP